MKEEVFIALQDLPTGREEVFAFFSDPANLEALTPPWLRFEVLTPRPLPRGEGALFDYRIVVRGLPLRWRTLIESFVPGERFVDRQIAGPYALWHHTHRFEDLPGGGTRMTDLVRFRVGWGLAGRIATALWVRRDVARIFEYRKRVLAERFGLPAPAGLPAAAGHQDRCSQASQRQAGRQQPGPGEPRPEQHAR